ncbi:MAG TPA: sialidase family protein [Anaerolineales bacterium]|nr:sialidase family protein [Anaerolineales bacterium]
MKNTNVRFGILLCFVLITACSAGVSSTEVDVPQTESVSTATEKPAVQPPAVDKPFDSTTDFAPANSFALTSTGDTIYMILGREHSLYVSRLSEQESTFTEPVLVTGEQSVHVLRVERPAISANAEGKVGVAWLELDFQGGDNEVWYAQSLDNGQTFEAPRLVGEDPPGESAMVQVLLDPEGNPILTWLTGNKLRFARSSDGGETFSEAKEIGKGACECCQPAMRQNGNDLLIAYRGMSVDEVGSFRDAALIKSTDGGETFSPVSFATDSHWYIDACPISGPWITAENDTINMTWMDGRADGPDNLMSSDVWFASSKDNGQTFSSNIKVSGDTSTHNFLPVMTVGAGGRIHIVWPAISPDAIYYSISDDNGQTFSIPQVIADDSLHGRPAVPSMVMDAHGRIYLAWLDDEGIRLAVWEDMN